MGFSMARSLRHIGKKRIPRERNRQIISRAIDHSDDRVAVITLAALIDVGLERAIKSRMRQLKADDYNAIFSGTGPLSGLSAKIRVAYGLGIIGPLVRNDLSIINEIRNVFAHAAQNLRLHDNRLWLRLARLNAMSHLDISSWRLSFGLDSKRGKAIAAMSIYAFLLSEIKFVKFPMKKLNDTLFGLTIRAIKY